MDPIKIVVVGDGNVGKTCLLLKYTRNQFPVNHVPTVLDTYTTNIQVDGKELQLNIWDTAGQEDYDRLRPISYPKTNVFILCFSIVDPDSFANARHKWHTEVKHHCPEAQVVLVGTKKDLKDDNRILEPLRKIGRKPITIAQGQEMKNDLQAACYLECSAKTREGVKEVFDEAIKLGINKYKKKKPCIIL